MTGKHHATRGRSRVALITCADLPDLDEDDRPLLGLLAERGVEAVIAQWTDPRFDWATVDLAVLRSPWDYARRRDEFVAWAASVPKLANPAPVVEWNTDKRYLTDLADSGVPVVPTTWLAPDARWQAPAAGEWVIKPAVSAGSRDTGRYQLADRPQRELALAHVRRLQQAGRLVMVQPYLPAVDSYGETALMYLPDRGGALRFSHAIRKGPMLTGPDHGVEGLFVPEQITARTATGDERAVAERVLRAVPAGGGDLLYARVDLIPGPDGAPLLVELELTEPSLFLAHAPGAAERFAAAITFKIASI